MKYKPVILQYYIKGERRLKPFDPDVTHREVIEFVENQGCEFPIIVSAKQLKEFLDNIQ